MLRGYPSWLIKFTPFQPESRCVTLVQVEAFDSEIESLQSNVKRKQKPPPRLAHLEESVNRHKTHIGRLEQIIRLLDNDALQPDELARVVNDEIPEYIDNNQEDFDAYEVNTFCQ